MSLPDYLSRIPNEQILIYLVILLSSLWFFNVAYKPELSFVVGVLVAVVYIYYHNEKRTVDLDNTNTQLHYKLNSLLKDENQDPPKYFYLDPDVINFFYSIRDFRVYNRDAYLKAIKTTDNLLMIASILENDFKYTKKGKLASWQNFGDTGREEEVSGISNHRELFELAETLGIKAVNLIWSFVISLPARPYKQKFQDSAERFHIIIKRILDSILAHCKKNSKDLLIGQHYGLPKPHTKTHEAQQRFNII